MTILLDPLLCCLRRILLAVGLLVALGVGFLVACSEDDTSSEVHAAPRVLIPVSDTTPAKLALLVGIGHYAQHRQARIPDLSGPANDLALVRKLLTDRFGFAEQDIVSLQDKMATHRNIVDVFHRHLIQKAGAETEVVFWFSGHGSRTKDRSGREKGGMDSTLLAYDSRAIAPDGSYDITDDELRSLLEALAKRTGRITLVTDNCHSGGAVRGGNDDDPPARGVVAGTSSLLDERLVGFWPQGILFLDDDDKRRADISRRFVHIAACTRDQLARAWRVKQESGPDRYYGTLTWFLVQTLNRIQKDQSWREVVLQVQLLLSCHRPGQTPVSDGACDRLVFGGSFKRRPEGLAAMPIMGDSISIRGGSLHGLSVGSVLEVRKLFATDPIGKAEVDHVHPNGVRAVARWIDGKPDGLADDEALEVLETSRPQNLPPLQLHVADAELAQSLAESQWVELVVAKQKADYLLEKVNDGFRFEQVDGPLIWPRPADDQPHPKTPEAMFQRELRFQALMRLPLQPRGLNLTARFVAPRPTELDGSDWNKTWNYSPVSIRPLRDRARLGNQPPPASRHHYEAEAAGAQDFPRLASKPPAGELAVLEVTNASQREVHLYVISLEESRQATVLWPWTLKGETLKSGKSQRIPIWMVGDRDWKLKRRMRDRYLILATLFPFDPEALIKNEPTRSGGRPIPAILQQVFEAKNAATRGDQVPVLEHSWGSTWLDVHVKYQAPK